MSSDTDEVGPSGVQSTPSTKGQRSKTKPTLQAKVLTPKSGNGLPILFGRGESVPGQVTWKSFMLAVGRYMQENYPRVASQYQTLKREERDAPHLRDPPEPPGAEATEQQVQIFLAQSRTYDLLAQAYNQELALHKQDMREERDEERGSLAVFRSALSERMCEMLQSAIPDLETSRDIIKIVVTTRKIHSGTEVISPNHLMVKSAMEFWSMAMTSDETLYDFRGRHQEAYDSYKDSGWSDLDDSLMAIKFVLNLPSSLQVIAEWKKEIVNKEIEAQASQSGDDPWPDSLETAYQIAQRRLLNNRKSHGLAYPDTHVNSLVRAAVQQGNGRGNRGAKEQEQDAAEDSAKAGKTHAQKPDKESLEKRTPPRECEICGGLLNDRTGGERHWDQKCPYAGLNVEERIRNLSSLLDAKESAMKTVKAAIRYHAADDDEDPDSDDIAGVSSVLDFVNSAGGKAGPLYRGSA